MAHPFFGPAPVDLRTAQGFFRAWRESHKPYDYSKEVKEVGAWRRPLEQRLEGCSLVLAFFCDPDDKEAMAQVTVPCDDRRIIDHLCVSSSSDDKVLLQQNMNFNIEPTCLYPDDMWNGLDIDENDEEYEYECADLKPTRVLLYMVDGQRGRLLHLFEGTSKKDVFKSNSPCIYYWDERKSRRGNEPLANDTEAVYIDVSIEFCWPETDGVESDRPEMNAGIHVRQGKGYDKAKTFEDVDDVLIIFSKLLNHSARPYAIEWR